MDYGIPADFNYRTTPSPTRANMSNAAQSAYKNCRLPGMRPDLFRIDAAILQKILLRIFGYDRS